MPCIHPQVPANQNAVCMAKGNLKIRDIVHHSIPANQNAVCTIKGEKK